jgi:hypothetical protein
MRSSVVLAALLAPALLGAQTTTRWTLGWTDNSYRYVDGRQVPVGPQTALLTVTPTSGDSVMATLPTSNPAMVDTLYGTMSATRLTLRTRPQGSLSRRVGDDGSVTPTGGVSSVLHLQLDLQGDAGTGTRTRELTLPPGMSMDPMTVRLTAARVP